MEGDLCQQQLGDSVWQIDARKGGDVHRKAVLRANQGGAASSSVRGERGINDPTKSTRSRL